MLTIQTQINIPFRLMIGGFKPTMNNPQGDPRYPMVLDENLLKMAEEIMDEIKKRGLKF